MSLLVERAEDYSLEDIKRLGMIDYNVATSTPLEYLFSNDSWAQSPMYYMGLKGTGKTLIWRSILTEAIYKDSEFLPLMFMFKHAKKVELLDPLKLAIPEVWGKRLEIYNSSTLDELTKLADVLVYDDIHYIVEAANKGNLDKTKFVEFFNGCLDQIEKKKKVVLISEDMMSPYAERLKIKEFDDILPKFGMCNPEKLTDYRYVKNANINYMAFREAPDLDYDS